MKHRFFIHFSTDLIIGLILIAAIHTPQEKHTKKPENTGKTITQKPLKYVTDTVYVSEETNLAKTATGTFIPATNTIKIQHFIPTTNNNKIVQFCRHNNANKIYTLRHEYEHARKAVLTKNTDHMPPMTRARIEVLNEVMAYASEIIQATDEEFHTDNKKKFISAAQKNIQNNRRAFWSYTTSVADTILKHATKQYVNTTKKGIYLHGIKKAYFSKQKNKYHPNHECLKINSGMFLPQINMWDPLWDFETKYGTINLWKLASNKQKQETLQKTDSIIHKTTGKNDIFLTKYKFY